MKLAGGRVAEVVGVAMMAFGFVLLITASVPGDYSPSNDQENYVDVAAGPNDSWWSPTGVQALAGLGVFVLGLLSWGSNVYFKLRAERRLDRAELREIHGARRNRQDTE